jgi:RNA polymerase sigma-B factor
MAPIYARPAVSQHLQSVPTQGSHGDFAGEEPVDRVDLTHRLLLEASKAAKARRKRLHEEVVLLNLDVAESIVLRYRNRGVPHEDLVQVACLGLVKAARGFDPAKSDNFLGYAVPTISGEVKRFFRDHAWAVRPPRRIQELQADISMTSAQLAQDSGHLPGPGELADVLGVDVADINEALAADGCFAPTSLDSPTRQEDGLSLSSTLGENDPGFDRAEAVVALRPLCRKLSPRDQRIIYLRFFREWTQAKIAAELGVTQMQVSRLLNRILGQLREQMGAATGLAETNKPADIAS